MKLNKQDWIDPSTAVEYPWAADRFIIYGILELAA